LGLPGIGFNVPAYAGNAIPPGAGEAVRVCRMPQLILSTSLHDAASWASVYTHGRPGLGVIGRPPQGGLPRSRGQRVVSPALLLYWPVPTPEPSGDLDHLRHSYIDQARVRRAPRRSPTPGPGSCRGCGRPETAEAAGRRFTGRAGRVALQAKSVGWGGCGGNGPDPTPVVAAGTETDGRDPPAEPSPSRAPVPGRREDEKESAADASPLAGPTRPRIRRRP
jgi:hypothetical protein